MSTKGAVIADLLLRTLPSSTETPTVELEHRRGVPGKLLSHTTFYVRWDRAKGMYQVNKALGLGLSSFDSVSTPREVLDMCATWSDNGYLTAVRVTCARSHSPNGRYSASCPATVFWELRKNSNANASKASKEANRAAQRAVINYVNYKLK